MLGINSLMYSFIGFFSFALPGPSSLVPGITFQINHFPVSLYFRFCIRGESRLNYVLSKTADLTMTPGPSLPPQKLSVAFVLLNGLALMMKLLLWLTRNWTVWFLPDSTIFPTHLSTSHPRLTGPPFSGLSSLKFLFLMTFQKLVLPGALSSLLLFWMTLVYTPTLNSSIIFPGTSFTYTLGNTPIMHSSSITLDNFPSQSVSFAWSFPFICAILWLMSVSFIRW